MWVETLQAEDNLAEARAEAASQEQSLKESAADKDAAKEGKLQEVRNLSSDLFPLM